MASMVSSTQGGQQLLEVTVVSCSNLKNTEWLSRQDPYVCLEYGNTKYRTRPHTDGGKNPRFQEKFIFNLIDGMSQLKLVVWNSNNLTRDDYIGSGEIHLQKVLSQGYDDTHCPLYTMSNRSAGDVWVIMHYSQANKPATSGASQPAPPSTASYAHSDVPYPPPPPYYAYPRPPAGYPPQPIEYHLHYGPPPSAYPPQPTASPPSYAPPPPGYPPIHQKSGSSYYAPDQYQGVYPPRPY